METITTTVALYENVQFGYRTLVATEMGERWVKESEYIRVSEIVEVALPLIAVDKDAAKAAALEAKAAALREQLAAVEAELQHPNNDGKDDGRLECRDEEAEAYLYGDEDTGEDCNVELQEAADAAREAATEDRLLGGAA